MKDALKSFAALVVGSVICLILAWLYLNGKAYSKTIAPPLKHPFWQAFTDEKPLMIAHRGGWAARPENTIEAFTYAASLDPRLVLWADIRATADGTLVAFRERDLAALTDGHGWIAYTSDNDVFRLDAGYQFQDASGQYTYRGKGLRIPRLTDLLEKFPDRRFILNVRDYKPGMVEKFLKIIADSKASDRIIVSSPEEGFLRDMREQQAMLLYGTSQAQATTMKMLASLGLQAVAPLRGDVFIFEPEYGRASMFTLSQSVIDEVHRREIKVVSGPALDRKSFEQLKNQGLDGILVADPAQILHTP